MMYEVDGSEMEFDQFYTSEQLPMDTYTTPQQELDTAPKDHKTINLTLLVVLVVVFLIAGVGYYLLNMKSSDSGEVVDNAPSVAITQGEGTENGNSGQHGDTSATGEVETNQESPRDSARGTEPTTDNHSNAADGNAQVQDRVERAPIMIDEKDSTLRYLGSVPELGNKVELTAKVLGKSVVDMDGVLLYRTDVELLEDGKESGKTLFLFLTKSSWDTLNRDQNLRVTLQIDNESRFSLYKVEHL